MGMDTVPPLILNLYEAKWSGSHPTRYVCVGGGPNGKL